MDLVSENKWWTIDRDRFLFLLSATYMDDYWYYMLCENLDRNESKGWIATLLTESLDLRTHLCVAEKYPELVLSSYELIVNGFSYENRPTNFLRKHKEIMSTVSTALKLSQ